MPASRPCSTRWSAKGRRSSPTRFRPPRAPVRGIAIEGEPDRLRRHAGHLHAAAPARPRHGRGRLGRRRRCRRRRRCWSTPRRGSTTRSRRSSEAGRLRPRRCLALNKIDLSSARKRCSSWPQTLNERVPFAATFMISALTGDGVERSAGAAAGADAARARGSIPRTRSPTCRCACSPPRSPARSSTLRLHEELPYALDRRDGGLAGAPGRLRADRPDDLSSSATASARSSSARAARPSRRSARRPARRSPRIAEPVHLFLFVKVRENWASDPERRKMMGLE